MSADDPDKPDTPSLELHERLSGRFKPARR